MKQLVCENVQQMLVKRVLAVADDFKGKSFCIALSGGSMIDLLNCDEFKNNVDVDYENWTIRMADERLVPISSVDSNYGEYCRKFGDDCLLMKQACFSHLTDEEMMDVDSAAAAEEAFHQKVGSFQLVLLGIGPDGHTASLFPEHASWINDHGELLAVAVENAPKPPPIRVTMTETALLKSEQLVFVACGESKQTVLKQIFNDESCQLPAAVIARKHPNVLILVDPAAAASSVGSNVD